MAKVKKNRRVRKADSKKAAKTEVVESRKKATTKVKVKIKPGADVTSCISKARLNDVDIFKDGCLLYLSRGNWGAKTPLGDDEYSDLPKEIVRGWKLLMSREPLKEIASINRGAGKKVKQCGIRFRGVRGMFFIPKDNIDRLFKRLEEAEASYWERVQIFIDTEFDMLRGEMRKTHPKFYEATAYPDKRALRSKFHWDADFMIIKTPDKDSGILSPRQYQHQVKREKERIRSFFNDALLIVSSKFLELTVKLKTKLIKREAFKASTLENLNDFIDAFPNLNVTGNKELADLVKTCKKYLKGVDAGTLRDSDLYAAEIGKNMSKVVKQFGKIHDGELLRSVDI